MVLSLVGEMMMMAVIAWSGCFAIPFCWLL
jgi:hypothetical protein